MRLKIASVVFITACIVEAQSSCLFDTNCLDSEFCKKYYIYSGTTEQFEWQSFGHCSSDFLSNGEHCLTSRSCKTGICSKSWTGSSRRRNWKCFPASVHYLLKFLPYASMIFFVIFAFVTCLLLFRSRNSNNEPSPAWWD